MITAVFDNTNQIRCLFCQVINSVKQKEWKLRIFVIYQETPGRIAFGLQPQKNPELRIVSRKCWWITRDLASLQAPSSQTLFRVIWTLLKLAVLIPANIPAAFTFIPEKHVSPLNVYRNFAFLLIFMRKAGFTFPMIRYPGHSIGYSPFHSCLEREAEYMAVVWIRNRELYGTCIGKTHIFKEFSSKFSFELLVTSN